LQGRKRGSKIRILQQEISLLVKRMPSKDPSSRVGIGTCDRRVKEERTKPSRKDSRIPIGKGVGKDTTKTRNTKSTYLLLLNKDTYSNSY
jgi:hypothetical protein